MSLLNLIRKSEYVSVKKELPVSNAPFPILVENKSKKPLTNFDLLSAVKNYAINRNSEDLAISSLIPNISITEFYTWLLGHSFECNQITFAHSYSMANKTNWVSISNMDIFGRGIYKSFCLKLDPDQFNATQIDLYHSFKIDCFTSINIAVIEPNSWLKVHLQPKPQVRKVYLSTIKHHYIWSAKYWNLSSKK